MSQTTPEKYTPVNKGHFDLEPPERQAAFTAKLASGWEEEYREYRRLWHELPKRREVRDYPLLVDLETVSRCNLRCPMCPTVTDEFVEKRVKPFKKGQIDYSLVEKIVAEVAGKIYSLRLSWIGEPTMHPRLIDAARLAKKAGIKEVSFLTNGSKLHRPYFEQLVDAGVDLITVSIDGMGDTYNRIRKPLKFNETLQKMTDIAEFKKTRGLSKPVIKIQAVWPAIRETPEAFYNTFAPIVDFIAFNPLIDYLHNDKDIVYEDNFACPQHYQRIVIGSNGEASMCSSDDFMDIDVGDATTETIHEIWHGEKLNQIRALHEQRDGFKSLKPCKNCFYPRKAAPDEIAMINGREIRIENYINRIQIVGR
jgi:radical SAM protein with 4Fe4S-binding SPASM domain